MTFNEVKDAISPAIGTEDVGSVFDIPIETFTGLRERAEALLVRQLMGVRLAQQYEVADFLEKALSTRTFKRLMRQVATAKQNEGPRMASKEDLE
jgi:hypothetical protein